MTARTYLNWYNLMLAVWESLGTTEVADYWMDRDDVVLVPT